jgi:hypothetical protein
MRTAVIRVNVDPGGELAEAPLRERMAALSESAKAAGIDIVNADIGSMPPRRRELEFLVTGDDAAAMQRFATDLCARTFRTTPSNGALTYISRGTDDDAAGILAGFGLTGEIVRSADDDGWDVVSVELAKADLERVPESRIQTALEASLNCEVRIIVR